MKTAYGERFGTLPPDNYPKHPTNGWMVTELEGLGYRIRGTKVATDAKALAGMLRDNGYDVSHLPRSNAASDSDER